MGDKQRLKTKNVFDKWINARKERYLLLTECGRVNVPMVHDHKFKSALFEKICECAVGGYRGVSWGKCRKFIEAPHGLNSSIITILSYYKNNGEIIQVGTIANLVSRV